MVYQLTFFSRSSWTSSEEENCGEVPNTLLITSETKMLYLGLETHALNFVNFEILNIGLFVFL